MRTVRASAVFWFLLMAAADGVSARALPFESAGPLPPLTAMDELVRARLGEMDIEPAKRCSDEVFVRRAFLDVTGTLPNPWEVRRFLRNRQPDKRAALIDVLLESETFADYWALKWCDLLRVKAEFPINLWPNAVQAYHRWIRDALRDNMPYDEFAREMLTASGSNFRVPQVNFYRAIQGKEPSAIAAAVALTFMGSRIERWPEDRRAGMETFFSRVAYKGTAEWKEEIVYLDPAPAETVEAMLPEGIVVPLPADKDPRRLFAGWLLSPDNPWFARNIVNRQWAWLMGRGIIHEADDIREDNPPSNPELLAFLERELIRSRYDPRHIYRLILNSQTYQQSSVPRSDHPNAEALFAYYPVRRLDAEVLIDALCSIFGPKEHYESAIPEPFTYIPAQHPAITLADGSISSQFLEMFGRPARDTGLLAERNNESTGAQRLHLLNSTHIQTKIQRSWRLRHLVKLAATERPEAIRSLYLAVLSRLPTEDEMATVSDHIESSGFGAQELAEDLAWALINTKEFLYRH